MQGIFLRNLCMKQKAGRLRSVLRSASFLARTIWNGRRVCFGHVRRKNVFDSAVRRVCGRAELRFS